jgi:hypothetical protein
MNLSSTQKKVVGVSVIILASLMALAFIIALILSLLDGMPADQRILASLLVISIFVFPIMWGFRLWMSARRELKHKNRINEVRENIDSGIVVNVDAKVELPEYRKLIFRMTYTRPLYIYFHVMGIIVLLLSWSDMPNNWLGLFTTIFILYLPVSVYRAANANYKSTQMLHEVIHYTFTPETITGSGQSFTSTLQWTSLYKFKESNDWMMLYTNRQVAMLIPKTAFASVEDMENFRKMAAVV